MLEAFADIVNDILDGLVTVVNFLVSWMPDSPFIEPINAMRSTLGSDILGYINYFLPISEYLAFLSAWVSAIFLYYALSIVLRWAKTIS